jgi:hypothetical protein
MRSCEFVERTLKQAEVSYERRMRLQSAGVWLTELVAVVCRHSGMVRKS